MSVTVMMWSVPSLTSLPVPVVSITLHHDDFLPIHTIFAVGTQTLHGIAVRAV